MPTLTPAGRRAVLICTEAQTDFARSLAVGLDDSSDADKVDEACTEAQAFIDTEAPKGSNVPRMIAVALSQHNYALSKWKVDILLNGEARPTDDGLVPIQAQILWSSEIDELLAQLP